MLAIRLPNDIENRLTNLAVKTGRTKTFYARKAILKYIEDLEDYLLAQHIVDDGFETITMNELETEIGLDDNI